MLEVEPSSFERHLAKYDAESLAPELPFLPDGVLATLVTEGVRKLKQSGRLDEILAGYNVSWSD